MKIRILTGVVGFGRNLKPGEVIECGRCPDANILLGSKAAELVREPARKTGEKRERAKKSV